MYISIEMGAVDKRLDLTDMQWFEDPNCSMVKTTLLESTTVSSDIQTDPEINLKSWKIIGRQLQRFLEARFFRSS